MYWFRLMVVSGGKIEDFPQISQISRISQIFSGVLANQKVEQLKESID